MLNQHLHDNAHGVNQGSTTAQAMQDRELIENFFYAQFAYLLESLDAIPEGTGTLLDNCVVLWAKSLSHGHLTSAMMYMFAGGAGGKLVGDRYVSFSGRNHNDVLTEACRLMGLDDVTEFGADPAHSSGPLGL